MDKGAWRAAQSRTRLKRRSTHTRTYYQSVFKKSLARHTVGCLAAPHLDMI